MSIPPIPTVDFGAVFVDEETVARSIAIASSPPSPVRSGNTLSDFIFSSAASIAATAELRRCAAASSESSSSPTGVLTLLLSAGAAAAPRPRFLSTVAGPAASPATSRPRASRLVTAKRSLGIIPSGSAV